MNPIFIALVKTSSVDKYDTDYQLIYDKPDRLKEYIKKFSNQLVEVIIRKPKTKRSDLQNSYYFGVVVEMLANELGYDKDEMHEILKYKFLQSNAMGMPYVKSTTKLSTGEFEDYLSKIKRWSAEFLHIVIPDPNEAE